MGLVRAKADVTDVPELVRYDNSRYDNGLPAPRLEPVINGEYVRYDQAAAIIAAKDEVQKTWQSIAKHHTGYENPSMAFRVLLERAEVKRLQQRHTDEMNDIVLMGMARDEYKSRAEAAEAKLAEIEKQEPVTHYVVSEHWAEFDKMKMMPVGRHPLYAAPIASS